LTNGDVHDNWPPKDFSGFLDMVAAGGLGETLRRMSVDKSQYRSPDGLGGAYENPQAVSDETIDTYLEPYLSSSARLHEVVSQRRFVANKCVELRNRQSVHDCAFTRRTLDDERPGIMFFKGRMRNEQGWRVLRVTCCRSEGQRCRTAHYDRAARNMWALETHCHLIRLMPATSRS
jgi:hypothetical protein